MYLEPDHAEDLVEESQKESHYCERDHDRYHRDNQIEEQRHDSHDAIDDRCQVCCKVKCHFGLSEAGNLVPCSDYLIILFCI